MAGMTGLGGPDWAGDSRPLFDDGPDLPPEAFEALLGLSPDDYAVLFPDPETKRLQDAEATAAYLDGTLEEADGMPSLVPAVAAASGDLLAKSDADLVGAVRACGQIMALAKSWMYEAVAEFATRRPGRAWDRRAAAAELEREDPDGPGEIPGPGELPRVPSREMVQELMLAMNWTEYRASAEAHRSVDLLRRLPQSFALLREGRVSEDHVKLVHEFAEDLSDAKAATLDARVAPWMEGRTTGALKDKLRRELIKLDPDAAERRRKRAERHARVSLYPNRDGTGTLAVEQAPAAQAAAAKARLNAIARASKSAGSTESVELLEAMTAIGLLLGTLPYIPPADGDNGGDGDGGKGEDPGPRGGPGQGWPGVPSRADEAAPGCALLPPGLRPASPGRIRLLSPWRTLAGLGGEPADLTWFGTVTPGLAREVAAAAAADPGTRWQVIVTDDAGRPLEVENVRRRAAHRSGCSPGVVDEVTLTIQSSLAKALARNPDLRRDLLALLARAGPCGADGGDGRHGPLSGVLADAVAVADRAAAESEHRARLDRTVGGCAHTREQGGYRITGRLRRWVMIRDRTCRNPSCRRPAAQCDLDHVIPYDRGGRTCDCDIGPECRTHHQLKQLPGWQLSRARDGTFTWTTPAGLAYRKEPYRYPV